MTRRAGSFIRIFVLIDPALHTDDSINGLCLGKSIVDGDTKGLKRDFAFAIPLGTGDISSTKAAGAPDPNPVGSEIHGGLDGTLHGATESNPALKLDTNLLTDALCIEFRLTDLNDINLNLRTSGNLGDCVGHNLDFGSLAPDNQSRTGGVKSDPNTVPGTLDDNFGEGSCLKVTGDVFADLEIFVKLVGVVLAFGIPLGAPVFVDGEAETDWINFLSHNSLKVNCSVWLIQQSLR
jgi:hypothetical protein